MSSEHVDGSFLLLHISPYLRGGPLKDERPGDAVEKPVQEPEAVRLGPEQGRRYVQTVTHGVMAACSERDAKCNFWVFQERETGL